MYFFHLGPPGPEGPEGRKGTKGESGTKGEKGIPVSNTFFIEIFSFISLIVVPLQRNDGCPRLVVLNPVNAPLMLSCLHVVL